MLERKELKELVVMTLENSEIHPKASALYQHIKEINPGIMREERVKSFRSFVKVINSFEEIKIQGSGVKVYSLHKNL